MMMYRLLQQVYWYFISITTNIYALLTINLLRKSSRHALSSELAWCVVAYYYANKSAAITLSFLNFIHCCDKYFPSNSIQAHALYIWNSLVEL